jgi:hypothetical protein
VVSEIVIGSAPTGVGFTLGGIACVDAQVTLTSASISVATGDGRCSGRSSFTIDRLQW